jgi:hypothetical protein
MSAGSEIKKQLLIAAILWNAFLTPDLFAFRMECIPRIIFDLEQYYYL